jgi:hypothetical protein
VAPRYGRERKTMEGNSPIKANRDLDSRCLLPQNGRHVGYRVRSVHFRELSLAWHLEAVYDPARHLIPHSAVEHRWKAFLGPPLPTTASVP